MRILAIAVFVATGITVCGAATQQDVLCTFYNSSEVLQSEGGVNPCNSTSCPSWAKCVSGVVVNLNLTSKGLTGTIPDLTPLPKLAGLNLMNNHLVGTIPPLSTLSNLKLLTLAYNNLSGTIPPLANLTELLIVTIGANSLSGSVPALPGKLTYFGAALNRLSGSIPSLPGTLTYLVLTKNRLDGQLPNFTSNLKNIYLGGNNFTGTIPALPDKLVYLDISGSHISGTIPDIPSGLSFLNLTKTYITGDVPALSVPCLLNETCLFVAGKQNSTCVVSFRVSGCDVCGPGNYSDTGAPPCLPCPSGTYSTSVGATVCQGTSSSAQSIDHTPTNLSQFMVASRISICLLLCLLLF